MAQYTGRITASLALASLIALAACGGDDARQDTSLASDSALSADLKMAGQDTAAQPQLTDVPAGTPATTPSTPTRTSTTPTRTSTSTPTRTSSGNTVTTNPRPSTGTTGSTGGGSVGTIAAGTQLSLASSSRVCTNTNKVGDRITATTTEAVTGSNGATIPAGATVTLTITRLDRSDNVNDPIRMEFAVNSLTYGGTTYALDATVASASVTRVRSTTTSRDAKTVAAGAAIGAIAGQVIGRDTKSTVIGAATGAAVGAAGAAATANYEGCVNQGASIVVRLSNSLQVRA